MTIQEGIGQRIRLLREQYQMSQTELALKVGYKDKTSIAKIEAGKVDLPQSKIFAFAKSLNTTPSYILGDNELLAKINTIPIESGYVIPVLGRVAAGYGKEAVEEVIGQIEISPSLASKGEFFGLLIKGDSMIPTLYDGDTVIVERTEDADSGDLVIALVNGSDATCKRLQKYAEGIALIPQNPIYEPMRFTEAEIDSTPVRILGKVVEMRRKF